MCHYIFFQLGNVILNLFKCIWNFSVGMDHCNLKNIRIFIFFSYPEAVFKSFLQIQLVVVCGIISAFITSPCLYTLYTWQVIFPIKMGYSEQRPYVWFVLFFFLFKTPQSAFRTQQWNWKTVVYTKPRGSPL